MRGRHERSVGKRTGLRWAAGAVGIGLAGTILLAMTPANASPQTVNAQLSLTGIATKNDPTGGSVIGIHPGDSVDFKAAAAPTAGLEALGLDSLLKSLGTIVSYQVTVDFSNLPGGKANTTLKGNTDAKFTFAQAGTYNFTWSAKAVNVLGLPIKLDGNQLKDAGVKLNASNEYVGKVVVAKKPPSGGISVQLPGVSVAPSAPVVGQLPTVGVPGVNLPTVGVHVPSLGSLVPTKPAGHHSGGGGKHTTHHGSGGNHHGTPSGLTVPEQVVPKGYTGPDVGGGYFPGVLPSLAPLPTGGHGVPTQASGPQSSSAAQAPAVNNKAKHVKPVDLASNGEPSSSIPVVLAIVAVIALTLVAATYARLYLLRRN